VLASEAYKRELESSAPLWLHFLLRASASLTLGPALGPVKANVGNASLAMSKRRGDEEGGS